MGQRVMKVETLLKTLQTAGCERVDVVQTGASWDIGFRGGGKYKKFRQNVSSTAKTRKRLLH